jgi:hypothetical protein
MGYAVHLIAIRRGGYDCLPAQAALQWRTAALTANASMIGGLG